MCLDSVDRLFITDRVVLLSAVYKWLLVDLRRTLSKPQPARRAQAT